MWSEIYNSVYSYKKDNITLDVHVVKNLGVFIECEEQEHMKTMTPEEKLKELTKIVKGLNLKIGNDFSCKKAYLKFKKENS